MASFGWFGFCGKSVSEQTKSGHVREPHADVRARIAGREVPVRRAEVRLTSALPALFAVRGSSDASPSESRCTSAPMHAVEMSSTVTVAGALERRNVCLEVLDLVAVAVPVDA